MKVRLHLRDSHLVDAEQFSDDLGQTWQAIDRQFVALLMDATSGHRVVRDLITNEWRAVHCTDVISVGPAGDLSELMDRETNRRVEERARLPRPDPVRSPEPRPQPPPPPPAP